METCSGSLYEKLPPTPDSPGDGDCTVMTLPEVRGPLYVDVPHGPYPPEGLLTPEASPGKQPSLPFFSSLREREKERTEISLLAQHISTLAEGFYLDPFLAKLVPSTISERSQSPSLNSAGLDSVPLLGEFYTLKSWKGLDLPIFSDDESLFEESILETLLQDLTSSPPLSPTHSSSSQSSPPSSPSTPECWCTPLHFDGVSAVSAGHFCSVQSAHCNNEAGRGAMMSPVNAGNMADGKAAGEVAMETEVAPSPLFMGIPTSPPLQLTASPASVPVSSPVSPASPGLPCAQSLLEELAALEPMFGAGASIAPGLGQQPELYQLQCHAPQQCFRKGESWSFF